MNNIKTIEKAAEVARNRFAPGFEGNGDWHDAGEEIADAILALGVEELRADMERNVLSVLHSVQRECTERPVRMIP